MSESYQKPRRGVLWAAACTTVLTVAAGTITAALDVKPPSPFAASGAGTSAGSGASKAPLGTPDFILDDGTAENGIGLTNGGQFLWFNRFTPAPADLPFDLDEVQVLFNSGTGTGVGDAVDIYIYTDADGNPANGATFVGSETGLTVQALDSFSTYALSPTIPITVAGDLLVMVVNRGSIAIGDFPAALDETVSQGRSWVGFDAAPPADPPVLPTTTMGTIDSFGLPGNWMIRANGAPSGPSLFLGSVGSADLCSNPPTNVNGVWEPGEIVDLTVTLTAGGFSGMTGISGTLTSATPGVTVLAGASTWPDIAANGSAPGNTPFQIQISSTIPCLTAVDLDLVVTANEGGPFNLTYANQIGLETQAPDVPIAISDNATNTSDLVISENVVISDLDIRVAATHSWVGDLTFTLTSPAATVVTLLDRPGVPVTSTVGCADNDLNVTFDDETVFDLESHCAATTPWFSGSGSPTQPLSAFDGQSTAGTWTLSVSDGAGGDTGTVDDWELIVTPAIGLQCNVCLNAGPAGGDLSILKTGIASPPGTVVYTISVANAGPGAVTGIVVTDTLPAEVAYVSDDCGGTNTPPWSWNVGTLNSGASATCILTTSVVTPGAILNTATVTADNDTTQGNNSSSATVIGDPPVPIAEVPTLDTVALAALLVLLATAAMVLLRRRSRA